MRRDLGGIGQPVVVERRELVAGQPERAGLDAQLRDRLTEVVGGVVGVERGVLLRARRHLVHREDQRGRRRRPPSDARRQQRDEHLVRRVATTADQEGPRLRVARRRRPARRLQQAREVGGAELVGLVVLAHAAALAQQREDRGLRHDGRAPSGRAVFP